ncbi:Alpha/Beta hydrolase protein [Tuber brumale]|nr:Alpha/Beta hydrolase protein [Tuber brumale]
MCWTHCSPKFPPPLEKGRKAHQKARLSRQINPKKNNQILLEEVTPTTLHMFRYSPFSGVISKGRKSLNFGIYRISFSIFIHFFLPLHHSPPPPQLVNFSGIAHSITPPNMKFTVSSVLIFSLPLVLAEIIPAPTCPVTNATTPEVDPTTQAWLELNSNNPSPLTVPIAEARAATEASQGSFPVPSIEITTKILSLPVGPTGNVTAYLYKPESGDRGDGEEDLLPVLVYFHGGGWIIGGPRSYKRLVLDLIRESGAAVLFIDYALSPEVVYPVAIEQCYAAVQWLLEHGEKLGVDPERMGFAGDSAGGELSPAVSLLSIKRKTPLPKYQVLIYPVLDLSCESATYREFAQGPGLIPDSIRAVLSIYTPDVKSRLEDIASPARASDEDLAKFPETLIITAEVDPLRQEGEDFGRRLQRLGVRAATFRVVGTAHGFVSINELAQTPATRATIELIGYKLKKALC